MRVSVSCVTELYRQAGFDRKCLTFFHAQKGNLASFFVYIKHVTKSKGGMADSGMELVTTSYCITFFFDKV